MKKGLKLLFAGLTLALGVGAFSTVLTTSLINNKKVEEEAKEVRATSWTQNPTIYFCPSDNWIGANATFKMNGFDNFWDGKSPDTSATGVKMSSTYNGRDIYKFTITSGTYVSHIQFLRMSTNGSQQWNYSNVFENNDHNSSGVNFVMMDKGHNWYDTWTIGTTDASGNSVYWVNTTDFIYKSSECTTPSSSTTRIFVYNSNTHWASGGKTVVRAWGGSASKTLWYDGVTAKIADTIYNLSWFQDDNSEYYGYCDIPVNASGFQIAEFTAENNYSAIQVTADYNSQDLSFYDGTSGFTNCVIYCPKEGNTVTAGGAHDDVCGAALLGKVIEAIDTCSSNEYNGYGAYGRVNYFFYNNGTKQIATPAAQSATVTSMGGAAASASTHIDAMASRSSYSANASSRILFANVQDSGTAAIIVTTSLVAISAVGGYFLLRKRREN